MNGNIIDLLVYLFETYLTDQVDLEQPYVLEDVYSGLKQAGFDTTTINHGLEWLRSISHKVSPLKSQDKNSVRIFHDLEKQKIDAECIDFIYFLEGSNILNPETRELLINSLMHLNADNIDVDDLQWLALIILFSQPEQEQAFASMESLMFDLPVEGETLD